MKSATGRWVSGSDFFDRDRELRILEMRVRAGNHVLLAGQRRMGKTSVARELGRRLTDSGDWTMLFTNVEDATCPEDVIADIAHAALLHDGYLEHRDDGYRFPSRLLKDWWAARFRDHHVPVARR